MITQPLIALDIGSTKVACAIGLPAAPRDDGSRAAQAGLPHEQTQGFELLGWSIVPYPVLSEAWLSDPLMVGRTIEQALEATAVSGDFHRALVAMSHPALASEHVRTTIHLGDEPMNIREHDLHRLKTRALDQVLSVDREPLVVERLGCSGNGFEGVREPFGRSATRLSATFHIVTMPTAARRALVQAVESAGLEVMQLVFSLQAVAAATGREEVNRQRALLIDIGGLNTDVGVLVEGRLQKAQTIPWGGLTLALAIARSTQATLEQAVTLSLEGFASRRMELRGILKRQLEVFQRAIEQTLTGDVLPDVALISGRGALIDGVAEWIEERTKIKTAMARSPRTQAIGDLASQMALSPVVGLLEMVTQTAPPRSIARPSRFVERLIDRTKTVLTEYF